MGSIGTRFRKWKRKKEEGRKKEKNPTLGDERVNQS